MTLTGLPLAVCVAVGAIGALVFAVACWRRGGRLRWLTRTGMVLLCEATALLAVAVLANRALDLYPSWASLVSTATEPPVPAAAPAARLDLWLDARARTGTRDGLAFVWQPAALPGWHLATAPVVYLPPAYFQARTQRFPVAVLVAPPGLRPARGGWDDRQVTAVARAAGDTRAILVFVRLTGTAAGTSAGAAVVGTALPEALAADLRAGPSGWAVVAVGPDAILAPDLLGAVPARYGFGAIVTDGAAALPRAVLDRLRADHSQQPLLLVSGPAAGTATVVVDTTPQVVPAAAGRVPAAVSWALGLLPAPLGPPVTGPLWIPPKPPPHPPHGPGGGHPAPPPVPTGTSAPGPV